MKHTIQTPAGQVTVTAPDGASREDAQRFAAEVMFNIDFKGRILIIGYGSVGEAMLKMVLRHITKTPQSVTVIDKEAKPRFQQFNKDNGVQFIKRDIVKNNLETTLMQFVQPGDFVIDASLNIDAASIVGWCLKHGVKYINTSLEVWRTEPDETKPVLAERTLFNTHHVLRETLAQFPSNAATCVVTHGANPGLVTHLVKRALLAMSKYKGKQAAAPTTREGWAELMRHLGVKVVHIAERDTQIINKPKEVNEFVNTWSCEGFWAEGRAPSELGYGSHENAKLDGGQVQEGGRAAFLEMPGAAVLMKSWVPIGDSYNGYLIQHSESITISEYFTTPDGKFNPSVYYVYQPCDAAIASLHELRGRELDLQVRQRIAKDEIVSGIDELGVLLITDKEAMWHGSQLSIDDARALLPGENATSIQVVASMLGAVVWAIQNPNQGYTEPEKIPFDFVLKYADPYLGPIPFVVTNWHPFNDKNSLFYREQDKNNRCSFENYRVWT